MIFSESGRAMVAYHSVLVFNVLGVSDRSDNDIRPPSCPTTPRSRCETCWTPTRSIVLRNLLESYHDAQQALDMTMNLFGGGYLPLEQRSLAERLFWAICRKIQKLLRQAEYVPEELERLDALLSETYFCNFSLFQSMPDSWAIKQLFPIMPIHRLNERPVHDAVLGDITCDSDGKIDQFHRPPRREADAAGTLFQRRALLPGRLPAGGLPGDPRRPAQPFRRHQRGPRAAGGPRTTCWSRR